MLIFQVFINLERSSEALYIVLKQTPNEHSEPVHQIRIDVIGYLTP